jgi:hypothetical protein
MSNDTAYTQPKGPKIIKPHKGSEYQNIESNWFRITAFFAGTSFGCVRVIQYFDLPYNVELAIGGISVVSGLMWLKYCRWDTRLADKNWIKFWFRISEKAGMHEYNKLTTSRSKFKKVFPFRKIHSKGKVECADNEYIVLVDLNPPRGSDDTRQVQTALNKALIDGLHDNMILKMFAVSKRNPRKAVVEHLMKIANKAGSKERAEHLIGILNKVLGDQTPVMLYRHYAMIGLGKHETVEAAEIARGSMVDGILLNMKRANLKPTVIENKRDILNLYRESMSERVVF